MKSREGSAAIVLLVIFVLAVVGAIAYAHYVYLPQMATQNSIATSTVKNNVAATTTVSIPVPVATSSSSNIYAGWQTYTDITGDFSVLYPTQYKVQSKLLLSNTGEADIYPVSAPATPLVSVSYSPSTQTPQSIFDLILSEVPTLQKKFPSLTYSTSTMMVGGSFSAQTIFTSGSGNDGAIYLFEANGENFQITANYDADSSQDVASNKKLADDIIATFKTTSPSAAPTNTTSWQSYTDAQFGITFPYPPGYWVQTSLAVGNSKDISVRPTDESQTSGIELMKISITPENTDSPQSEITQWTSDLQYGRYNFSTSTVTVAGYPAQKFSLSKPSDNGALYIFGNGTYTFVISAYYDDASSLPNSPTDETTNQVAASRIVNGLSIH